jgi:hypothetical protein
MLRAELFSNSPGRFELDSVSLAIIEAKGVQRKPLVSGDGEDGGRIQPSTEENNCVAIS